MERYRLGILGATGMVGQRLVSLLEGHPWFELHSLAASDRSAGKRYGEAVNWLLPGDPPREAAEKQLCHADPEDMAGCDLYLASLGSAVARKIEGAFADYGAIVISNSSAYRMDDDVPLVIPEVNASHLEILKDRIPGKAGMIVTNPNCSVIGVAMVMAPLHHVFGIRRAVVTTMQALSGAGLAGPLGLKMVDNIVPYVPTEEEKIETETAKVLGTVALGKRIVPADIAVSAHCHRVPVRDGHMAAVSIELSRIAQVQEVIETLRGFRGETAGMNLPSAPDQPISVRFEDDRPQPALDRNTGSGMTVVVGRVRQCPVLSVKLELLTHNTMRGAAGAALLNAEAMAARGMLPGGRSE